MCAQPHCDYILCYILYMHTFLSQCYLCLSLMWLERHTHNSRRSLFLYCKVIEILYQPLSPLVFVVSFSRVDGNMWTAAVMRMRWMNKPTGLSLSACGPVYRQPLREFKLTPLGSVSGFLLLDPKKIGYLFFPLLHSPDFIFQVLPSLFSIPLCS